MSGIRNYIGSLAKIVRSRDEQWHGTTSAESCSDTAPVDHTHYDVAFYVPWIGPLITPAALQRPPGGAETQISLLSRALARHGTKVCLIAFELPGARLPNSLDDVKVSARPPYRTRHRFGKIRETFSIGRAVLRVNSLVVVARGATPDVGIVAIIAKFAGRRFVYSSANVSDFKFLGFSPARRNKALFRHALRLADEVVVQTQEQVALCQDAVGRTPVLIKSIAESAPLRNRVPEAFLWIGRLVWYKRPLAFVDLARSLPDAEFWMIGVPPMLADGSDELIQTLEEEASAVPNLKLLRPEPRNQLMERLNRAVAVVNTADFEGMPNIFLEGWARGVPALALTHDPDGVIQRYGLGAFAGGSRETFREIARRLWKERMTQDDLAASCREYVRKHHSPEAIATQWKDALGLGPAPEEGAVGS
jgi:glycosyltransferase involved in cell wall biosynthesis